MRAFRFRFASLLRLRKQELDQRRQELARETRALAAVEQEVEAAVRRHRAAGQALQRALATPMASLTLRSGAAYLERCIDALAQASQLRDAGSGKLRDARERVLGAWRGVRALELLRSRELEAHRAESRRREQRELDEIGNRVGNAEATR